MQERTCKECGKTKPIGDFQKTGKLYKDGSPKYFGKCKECMNAYKRDYLAKNPDKRKAFAESTREWAKANRDRRNQYHREYAKKNPEEIKEAQRKWRKNNKDVISEYWKSERGRKSVAKWREKSTDKLTAYSRKYKTARLLSDPEFRKTIREYVRRRRVRRKGAGGAHTLAEWEALKAQHNYACLCCKKQEPEIALSRDHVLPLTMGGSDDIANIQPLCFSCNARKNDKHIDYR